jgi:hypothetical protein
VPKASLPKKKTISLNILRSLEFARLVVVWLWQNSEKGLFVLLFFTIIEYYLL